MEVTETVFEQYQAMQRSAEVNMLNKSGVQRVAMDKGYDELAAFIDEGDYYSDLIEQYEDLAEQFA